MTALGLFRDRTVQYLLEICGLRIWDLQINHENLRIFDLLIDTPKKFDNLR